MEERRALNLEAKTTQRTAKPSGGTHTLPDHVNRNQVIGGGAYVVVISPPDLCLRTSMCPAPGQPASRQQLGAVLSPEGPPRGHIATDGDGRNGATVPNNACVREN